MQAGTSRVPQHIDPVAVRDSQEVRDAAREILARPEFKETSDGLAQRIAGYILDPVGTLSRILDWLLFSIGVSSAGGFVGWAIALLAALIIVLLLVRLTISMSRDDAAPMKYAPETGDATPQELDELAEAAERDGRWREAIRLRYGATVVRLAEEGLVERRPGRTTGEYLREVTETAPTILGDFRRLTALFEWVWYGKGVPDKDHVRDCREWAQGVAKVAA